MNEKGTLPFGNTNIDFSVIRSSDRRKSISIFVDPYYGVYLRAPVKFSKEKIMSLLLRKAAWIIQKQKIIKTAHLLNPPKEFVSGETFLYRGRQCRLKVEYGCRRKDAGVKLKNSRFLFSSASDSHNLRAIKNTLTAWYKDKAEIFLNDRVRHYSSKCGFEKAKVIIANQTSRWGSCNRQGELRFNWRIIMAPKPLIDYVVVHELCHLKHRNHSDAFWKEVGTILPNYETLRARLKKEGFAYNF